MPSITFDTILIAAIISLAKLFVCYMSISLAFHAERYSRRYAQAPSPTTAKLAKIIKTANAQYDANQAQIEQLEAEVAKDGTNGLASS